jgi:hypothetical protein
MRRDFSTVGPHRQFFLHNQGDTVLFRTYVSNYGKSLRDKGAQA